MDKELKLIESVRARLKAIAATAVRLAGEIPQGTELADELKEIDDNLGMVYDRLVERELLEGDK